MRDRRRMRPGTGERIRLMGALGGSVGGHVLVWALWEVGLWLSPPEPIAISQDRIPVQLVEVAPDKGPAGEGGADGSLEELWAGLNLEESPSEEASPEPSPSLEDLLADMARELEPEAQEPAAAITLGREQVAEALGETAVPENLPELPALPAGIEKWAGEAGEGEGGPALGGGGIPGDTPRPGVVAVYIGGEITQEDLRQYMRTRHGLDPRNWQGPAAARVELAGALLGEMILRKMAVRKAEERGLADQASVQRAIKSLAEDESIVELVRSVEGKDIPVSEEEVAKYYEDHKEMWEGLSLESVWEFVVAAVRREKAAERWRRYVEELRRGTEVETYYQRLTDTNARADEAVFTVAGEAFTVGEWRALVAEASPEVQAALQDPEKARQVAEDLLLRKLLLMKARDLPEETMQERFEVLRERMLAGLLHRAEVDDQIEVEPEEVLAHYEEVKGRYQTMPRARVTFVRVETGETVEGLQAAQQKLDRLKAWAGEKGWALALEEWQRQEQGVEVREQWVEQGEHDLLDLLSPCARCQFIFGAEVGEVSKPLGWRRKGAQVPWVLEVMRVEEKVEPRRPTLDEIRPFMEMEVWERKHEAAERRLTEKLFREADLKVNEEALCAMVGAVLKEKDGERGVMVVGEAEASGNERKGRRAPGPPAVGR